MQPIGLRWGITKWFRLQICGVFWHCEFPGTVSNDGP